MNTAFDQRAPCLVTLDRPYDEQDDRQTAAELATEAMRWLAWQQDHNPRRVDIILAILRQPSASDRTIEETLHRLDEMRTDNGDHVTVCRERYSAAVDIPALSRLLHVEDYVARAQKERRAREAKQQELAL
jgi:hypothetical protein